MARKEHAERGANRLKGSVYCNKTRQETQQNFYQQSIKHLSKHETALWGSEMREKNARLLYLSRRALFYLVPSVLFCLICTYCDHTHTHTRYWSTMEAVSGSHDDTSLFLRCALRQRSPICHPWRLQNEQSDERKPNVYTAELKPHTADWCNRLAVPLTLFHNEHVIKLEMLKTSWFGL